MKNGKDFRKINNGIYGAINFNNMIPVVDAALIEIDISNLLSSEMSLSELREERLKKYEIVD
jgi:protein AbiQ